MTQMYNIFGIMSPDYFKELTDKSNSIGQVLLSHWLAYHGIVAPVIASESPHRNLSAIFHRMSTWVKRIDVRLPPALKFLNEWCESFVSELTKVLFGKLYDSP
jgi:hypothetical protein